MAIWRQPPRTQQQGRSELASLPINTRAAVVTWAEMEVPEAPVGTTETVGIRGAPRLAASTAKGSTTTVAIGMSTARLSISAAKASSLTVSVTALARLAADAASGLPMMTFISWIQDDM